MSTILQHTARYLIWALVVAVPLLLWHTSTSNGGISPLILPPLGDVRAELGQLLEQADTYKAFQITLGTVALAAIIAIGTGLIVGAAGGTSRFIGELIEPVLTAASAIPIVMAYPLCVFIFGIGATSKVAFAALFAFLPVASITLHATRNIDAGLVTTARAMGATRWRLATKILIPAALPGIRVAIGFATMLAYLGVVAGEMLTSRDGAGNRMVAALDTYETAEGYAWILLIVAVPMIVRLLAGAIGRADLGHRRHHIDLTKYAATDDHLGAAPRAVLRRGAAGPE